MSSVIPLDPQGHIEVDVPCRGCGYNLRGLAPGGGCPECGADIASRSDDLRFSDAIWLERIASGAGWLVLSVVGGLVAGIIVALVDYAIAELLLIGVLWGAITLVGFWQLTVPEPGASRRHAGWTLRNVVRWLAVGSCAIGVVDALPPLDETPAGDAVSLLSTLLGLVVMVLGLLYTRRFALRVPDRSLALQTSIVAWGLGISVALAAIVMALEFSAPRLAGTSSLKSVPAGTPAPGTPAQPGLTPATMPFAAGPAVVLGVTLAVGCAAGLGGFAFGIWWIVLLLWYRRAFLRAASQARTTSAST